jgi:hypothetical protein
MALSTIDIAGATDKAQVIAAAASTAKRTPNGDVSIGVV